MKDLSLQHSRVLGHQLCSGERWGMVTTHLWWLFVSEQLMRKPVMGLNSIQYCEEVLGPYLLPLMRKISPRKKLEVIEDGASSHTSKYTWAYRLQHGIRRLLWPASSPGLNLIENVWALLKNNLRRQWRNPYQRPHNERRKQAPWSRIYSWYHKMPIRVLTVAVEVGLLAGERR